MSAATKKPRMGVREIFALLLFGALLVLAGKIWLDIILSILKALGRALGF